MSCSTNNMAKVRVKRRSSADRANKTGTAHPAGGNGRLTLMPHQRKALKYSLQRKHPAFFMEMRLGKTLVAIRWAQGLYPPATKCLVVAPSSVFVAWEKELSREGERFLPAYGKPVKIRASMLREAQHSSGRTWYLINYESLLATDVIAFMPWDVVILDESTRIRNPQTKTSKLCTTQFRNVRHRCILSGSPAPESELDLFQQFKFLYGSFLGCRSYWEFRNKYFELDWGGYSWRLHRSWRTYLKEMLHNRAFVLRRSQAGMKDRKVHTVRHVPMNKPQERMCKEILADFDVRLENGEVLETDWLLTRYMWLSRLAGGFDPEGNLVSPNKKNEVLSLLTGELSREKVVIWFRFRSELEYVRECLEQANISCVWVHGGVPTEDRAKAIRSFNGNRLVRCFLATEKTAKFGIDVSAADTMIYYSNEWSCEDRTQSEDRIVHPKKESPLLYIDLVTVGSIDETIVETVREKAFNAQMLMSTVNKRILSDVQAMKSRLKGTK